MIGAKMEKWQLAGIFSVEPRTKLDLTQIGNLRKSFQREKPEKPPFELTLWLKTTCRKMAKAISLF